MDLQLKDKVFVVTGASAGIGEATVHGLAAEGATAVGVSRKPAFDAARGIDAVAADVTDRDAAQFVIDTVLSRHGRIDGLVNNVGGLDVRSSFLDITDDQWRDTFELNLFSAVRLSRAVIPALREAGHGSLVHVASEAARFPDVPVADYAAAKLGLLSLSKTIATEFGPEGIRSNVVSPGPTRTRLWNKPGGFAEQLSQEFDLP